VRSLGSDAARRDEGHCGGQRSAIKPMLPMRWLYAPSDTRRTDEATVFARASKRGDLGDSPSRIRKPDGRQPSGKRLLVNRKDEHGTHHQAHEVGTVDRKAAPVRAIHESVLADRRASAGESKRDTSPAPS
jgi:hypothetical protein